MKLACCIKYVPDTNAQPAITPDGKDIQRSALNFVMSPYDEFAVEEALRIREKNAGTTVTVITLGPEQSDQVLRTGLAMGADQAIHLVDEKNVVRDPLVVAKCLAAELKTGQFDLIFCGRQAIDDDSFQVGGALAEFLNAGCIALAGRVTLDGKDVTVERVIEGGAKQTLTGTLPLVITAQKGLNEPRFASLPGIMKAKSKPVTKKKISELGVPLDSMLAINNLKVPMYERKKHIIPADKDRKEAVQELLDLLRKDAKVLE